MDSTRREFLKTAGIVLAGSGIIAGSMGRAQAQARGPMKIKGQAVVKGVVKAQAIVSTMPISFTGGMDPYTGIIREPGHVLQGQSVAGKILVFPVGKGSTTGSWQFLVAYKQKKAPVGIINVKAEGVVAVSAVITNTPMMHLLEKDPLEVIRTGDTVIIDADHGFVEVIPA